MNALSNLFLSKKRKPIMELGEEKWLGRLDMFIEKNLKTDDLSNKKLAEQFEISERQLFRKVKELSELPPQKYLRHYRLQKAMKYLKSGKYRTVKETSYAVGFSKVSYFIAKFDKQFGKKPLRILKENGWR